MCSNILNLKVGVRALTQKRTHRLRGHEGEEVLLFCIIVWRLFLVIFHFGRLKFERDPVVDSKVNPNSEELKMFTRLDFIQNRMNVK